MGGVSGNAGLFSTADDLGRFARMLLHDGVLDGERILRPGSVAALEAPATLDADGEARTSGWALQAPLVANRYRLPAAARSPILAIRERACGSIWLRGASSSC